MKIDAYIDTVFPLIIDSVCRNLDLDVNELSKAFNNYCSEKYGMQLTTLVSFIGIESLTKLHMDIHAAFADYVFMVYDINLADKFKIEGEQDARELLQTLDAKARMEAIQPIDISKVLH